MTFLINGGVLTAVYNNSYLLIFFVLPYFVGHKTLFAVENNASDSVKVLHIRTKYFRMHLPSKILVHKIW